MSSAIGVRALFLVGLMGCGNDHADSNAPIERRERPGGLLNFYYRRAA